MAYRNKEDALAKSRELYHRNPAPHLEKQKRQREARFQWLLENVGDCCTVCGSTERLEFDHLNPSLKRGRISFRANGIERLKQEVDNIQTLCHDCHVKKSTAQKKAAWSLFCQLSLEEQNELINQFL